MSFLHLSLFGLGSLGIAIPVALHLLLRQKPRRIVFPATRFLIETHVQNRRDLRLRQWLLLALRCGLILLLAAALARPTVRPDLVGRGSLLGMLGLVWLVLAAATILAWLRRSGMLVVAPLAGLTGLMTLVLLGLGVSLFRIGSWRGVEQEAPVAAVLLVDLAPRMDYRDGPLTSLTRARQAMGKLFGKLPPGSEVAILTTLDRTAVFGANPQEFRDRVEHLGTGYLSRPLPEGIELARELLKDRPQERHELYIFTDLTRSSWDPGGTELGTPGGGTSSGAPPAGANNAEAAATPEENTDDGDRRVEIYVIDVGSPRPINYRVEQARLSADRVTSAAPVSLELIVRGEGSNAPRPLNIELYLEQPDPERPVIVDGKPVLPELILRDSVEVTVEPGKPAAHTFQLNGLEPGTHHGRLRIHPQDGLTCDDEHYFSVEVGAPAKVLVVPGPGAESSFLREALAPYASRVLGKSRFICDTATSDSITRPLDELAPYAAIALVDPPGLSPEAWARLEAYVQGGGGLVVFLGRNARPVESFHDSAALRVLPGKLARQWRAGEGGIYFAPRDLDHPVLRPLRASGDVIPWSDFPVYRHWTFTEPRPRTVVLLSFGNGNPAILEGRLGRGRVVTVTTPISDGLNIVGRAPWNLFPTGPEPWPFFVLANEIFSHVAQGGDGRRNFLLGERPSIPWAEQVEGARVRMFSPAGAWQTATVGDDGTVSIPFLDLPGTYRLRTNDPVGPRRGFSANLAPQATRMERMTMAELAPRHLPRDFHAVQNPGALERAVSEARVGRDIFPWCALLAALVLAAEQILANRFYRGVSAPQVPVKSMLPERNHALPQEVSA